MVIEEEQGGIMVEEEKRKKILGRRGVIYSPGIKCKTRNET